MPAGVAECARGRDVRSVEASAFGLCAEVLGGRPEEDGLLPGYAETVREGTRVGQPHRLIAVNATALLCGEARGTDLLKSVHSTMVPIRISVVHAGRRRMGVELLLAHRRLVPFHSPTGVAVASARSNCCHGHRDLTMGRSAPVRERSAWGSLDGMCRSGRPISGQLRGRDRGPP